MKKIYNILSLLCLFISFFIIILFVYNIAQCHLIAFDDMYDSTFPIFSPVNSYHGRVLESTLEKISTMHIPLLFGIHPLVWFWGGNALIKGCILLWLFYLISSCIFIFKKNNFLFQSIFMLFLYGFYQIHVLNTPYGHLNTALYYYTLALIPFLLFWKKFIYIYINNEFSLNSKTDKKNIIILSVYSLFLGMSSELTYITSFFSLILILLTIKLFRFNIIYKRLIIPFICLIIGIISNFFVSSFQDYIHQKGMFISLHGTISEILILFKDFTLKYFLTIKSEFLIYLVIIAILYLIILFFNNRDISFKKKINNVHFLIPLVTISVLLFYYSLLFVGIASQDDFRGAIYYLNHFDLVFEMKFVLLTLIFLELGIIYIKDKIFYIILTCILVFSLFKNSFVETIKENVIELKKLGVKEYTLKIQDKEYIIERRENRYLLERIFLYYALTKKVPNLLCSEDKFYVFSFFYAQDLIPQAYYGYMSLVYKIPDLIDENQFEYNCLYTYEDVYNKYLENGGPEISEEEIEKADFQSLFDRNLVLYGRKSN